MFLSPHGGLTRESDMPGISLLTRKVTEQSGPDYKEGHTLYHKHSSDAEVDKAAHAKQKFSFTRRFRSQRKKKQGLYGGGIGEYGGKRSRGRNTFETNRLSESFERSAGKYDTEEQKKAEEKRWEGRTHIFKHPKKPIHKAHIKSKFI